MKLNLARTKQIVGSISEFAFEHKDIDLNLKQEGINSVGPVRVVGTIENLGDRVFGVIGRIEAIVSALCSRCLEETSFNLETDLSLKFSDIITELGEEDVISFSGDEIDLCPSVAREIILKLPSQILCKTDCKGLCQSCGANRNKTVCHCKDESIDPRLAVLKELLKE